MTGTQNLAAVQEGGKLTADNFTTNIIEQFIKEADVSTLTQKSYRNAAKDLLKFLSAKRAELSETSLIDYRENLKATRTPRGAKLYFGVAKHFTKWLNWRGYICRDFGAMLKGVKVDLSCHVKDSLELSEVVDVLKTMHDKTEIDARNCAIFSLLVTTGIRVSSLVEIKLGDIERRKNVWTIKIFAKGHSGKDSTVILPDETKKLIDKYLKLRGKVKNSDYLFTSCSRRNKGSRLTTQSVSKLCKKIFRTNGIDSPRLTAHSCRATCATLASNAGIEIEQVAECLLHASSSTTRIYIKSSRVLENPTSRAVADLIFSNLKGVAA